MSNEPEIVQGQRNIDLTSTCCICLSCKSPCGLFPINLNSKQLLSEMFNVQMVQNSAWKVCVTCLRSIEKAAEFKKMAKRSEHIIQDIINKPTGEDEYQVTETSYEELPNQFHNQPLPVISSVTNNFNIEIHENDFEEGEIPEPMQEMWHEDTQSDPHQMLDSIEIDDSADDGDDADALSTTTFTCEMCRLTFKTKFCLDRHRYSEHNKVKHVNQKERGERGYAVKRKDGYWSCCGEIHSKETLAGHRQEKHPWLLKQKICPVCHKKVKGNIALRIHHREEHQGEQKQCTFCNKIFPHRNSLHAHVWKYHPTERNRI